MLVQVLKIDLLVHLGVINVMILEDFLIGDVHIYLKKNTLELGEKNLQY